MATLLAMNAGPALAADDGCIGPRADNGKCIGVGEDWNHHNWNDWDHWDHRDDWDHRNDWDDWDDWDHHNFYINDFDDFYDDCELIGWDDGEAIYVCEIDV